MINSSFLKRIVFVLSVFLLFNSCTERQAFDKNKIIIKKATIKKNKLKKLKEKKSVIKKGDTIINLLKTYGMDYERAFKMFSDVKPVFDLRKLNVDRKYSFFFEGKTLKKFNYQIDDNSFLQISNLDKTYQGVIKNIPYKIKDETIQGIIETSLFDSIIKIGEKPELADMMASLYEYDIDFNRDLRKGDKYSLIVEKKYLDKKFKGYKRIIAADFIRNKNSIKVIMYEKNNGTISYYHPDGSAVKKMFLKSPLPFMRVTSRYGYRKHPILGYSAKHNGVDLGAKIGTRVKVTAGGIVLRAGYNKLNGRYIEVRHPNKYITQYLHLNGIKRGIKRGVRVVQGQIIGFVGNTGRSTGPHLHYGVKKNNRYINPLSLKSPKLKPLKNECLKEFKIYAGKMINKLQIRSVEKSIELKINEILKDNIQLIKDLKIR